MAEGGSGITNVGTSLRASALLNNQIDDDGDGLVDEQDEDPNDRLDDNSRLFSATARDLDLFGLTLTGGRTIASIDGGGAVRSDGKVTLIGTTVSGNSTAGTFQSGGGILADTITVISSTVSGNSVAASGSTGGGLAGRQVALTESTVSGNSTAGAFGSGGGIIAESRLSLADSIVSGNAASLSVFDDIAGAAPELLAGNIVGSTLTAADGTVSTVTASEIFANTVEVEDANGKLTGIQSGRLADNGGPTPTILILAGGAAQDTGGDGSSSTDQRGEARPFGTANDLGAVELQTAPNAPPVANPLGEFFEDFFFTDEDTAITFNSAWLLETANRSSPSGITVEDIDPDGDPLTVISVDDSETTGLVFLEDGQITYDPNGAFENLVFGSAFDQFSYRISDGRGGFDDGTVFVQVNGVNDPPTANPDTLLTDSATPISFSSVDLTENDTDVETGTLLGVNSVQETSETRGAVSYDPRLRSGVYDPDGAFDFLSAGETATDVFEYILGDFVQSDIGTVTVTITGVDDAPIAVDDSATFRLSDRGDGGVIAIDVLANDRDPDGDAISVIDLDGDALSPLAQITDNGDGTANYSPNGWFAYLAAGETGRDSFDYTISDGAMTDSATVTVTVEGDNTPYNSGDAFRFSQGTNGGANKFGFDGDSFVLSGQSVSGRPKFSDLGAFFDRAVEVFGGTVVQDALFADEEIAAGAAPPDLEVQEGGLAVVTGPGVEGVYQTRFADAQKAQTCLDFVARFMDSSQKTQRSPRTRRTSGSTRPRATAQRASSPTMSTTSSASPPTRARRKTGSTRSSSSSRRSQPIFMALTRPATARSTQRRSPAGRRPASGSKAMT